MMAVDVVVINYHTDDLLRDFIDSYGGVKFDGCTLTVVHVESATHFGPWMQLCDTDLHFRENIGYARACNAGARGSNDAILFANADTLLSGDFKECYHALMGSSDRGILGPRQVNEHNQITAGGILPLGSHNQQRGWNESDYGQYSDILECPFIAGSLLFVKRSVWEELASCPFFKEAEPEAEGAFIHTRHYFEDTWLGYHARAHGYKCIYYGPAKMTHLWHKSSPIGGIGEQAWAESQARYRRACEIHGIAHE